VIRLKKGMGNRTRRHFVWILSTAVVVGVVVCPAVIALGADPFPGGPGTPIGAGLPPGTEPSGLVWQYRLGKLLMVSDQGRLLKLDGDGSDVEVLVVPGDLEGVCVADQSSNLAYVAVENPEFIKEIDIRTGHVTRSFVLPIDLPPNQGLEALTFVPDPANAEGGLF
jgi:hypothetical protein